MPAAGSGGTGEAGEGAAGEVYEPAGSYAAGTGGMAGAVAGTGGAGRGGSGAGGSGGSGGGGSGGSAANGGSGGTGGSAAGSGGGGSGGAMGGGEGGCPTQYTMATHIVMNVSWAATKVSGIEVTLAGSGKVHLWTKNKFDSSTGTTSIESMSCGTTLPEITTSQLADGGSKVLPEIPDAAWDSAMMPKFYGTETTSGSTKTISAGTALVGLTLTNPNGTWPAAKDITGVDHDGDGKPGVSAIPRNGSGYKQPPTSLAKTNRADKLYLAIRNVMTLSGPADECPDTSSGTVNVSKFENHVIGCHVAGGGECTTTERDFVDSNRTVYTVSSATFESKIIDDAATCADARAALPAQ